MRATNTGAITLVANAGSSYSFDNGPYGPYPAGGYVGLLPGSTHTVNEQNAAGCNSAASTVLIDDATRCSRSSDTVSGRSDMCNQYRYYHTCCKRRFTHDSFDNGPYGPYPAGGYVGLLPGSNHILSMNKMPLVVTLLHLLY